MLSRLVGILTDVLIPQYQDTNFPYSFLALRIVLNVGI